MSDFSFGDADDSLFLDQAVLAQIESIERSATMPPRPLPIPRPPPRAPTKFYNQATISFAPKPPPSPPSSDGYDMLDTITPSELAEIERAALEPPKRSLASRPHLGLGVTGRSSSSSQGVQTHLPFRKENPATRGKRWDRTAFSATGRRRAQPKGKGAAKGKARAWGGEDDEEEEEDWDDEEPLLPPPACDLHKPYEPPRHEPNEAAIATYIYPSNRPVRSYQYDIIKAALTDNCLVALPTGLGKTFIAGVVMLNYYRWFPSAKIVFLAPTKPLVQQQHRACHDTCGLPQADSVVMTGEGNTAAERAVLWQQKRVFYCTPQTLMNDLAHKAVDPRDIVLAVFDEAHKASGNYAYTTINAYLMAHHPYFRVLALTATPGADVPKVQAVVDALHISRIEIREENDFEVRKYVNEKSVTQHHIEIDGVFANFRDRWASLMKPLVSSLVSADILDNRDLECTKLRAFRILSKKTDLVRRNKASGGGGKAVQGYVFPSLTTLHTMAGAMGHLLEFSVTMFSTALQGLGGAGPETVVKGKTKKPSGNQKLLANKEFRQLKDEASDYIQNCNSGGCGLRKSDKHPKMKLTRDLLVEYFEQAAKDSAKDGTSNDTRAMVFCSFRPCVMDLVEMLNGESDLLRATKFVGQSRGKSEGDTGFTQKDQKQTVKDFVAGKFNILVSTSIGEEGLDIGEVDMVICYDMPKTSIKLLQRIGRTGRKRQGQVHVLMTKGREHSNYDGAQDTHREIQLEILHSRNLELFEDVERLLPGSELPNCVEQDMEIGEWAVEEPLKRRKSAPTGASKRVRGEPVPEGAQVGFESVLSLLQKNGAKGKAPTKAKAPAKRKASATHIVSDSEGELPDAQDLLTQRQVDTSDSDEQAPPPKKGRKTTVVKKPAAKPTAPKRATKKKQVVVPSSSPPAPSPAKRPASGIDFLVSEPAVRKRVPPSPDHSPEQVLPSSTSPSPPPPNLPAPSSHHPPRPKQPVQAAQAVQPVQAVQAVQSVQRPQTLQRLDSSLAAKAGFSQVDMNYVLESSDDELLLAAPKHDTPVLQRSDMPPPAWPSSPVAEMDTQSPVRRLGLGLRRRVVQSSEPTSPPAAASPVPETPAKDVDTSPLVQRGVRRLKKQRLRQNALMDLDVEISGSESADEVSSDYEDEADRRFVNDLQPTQAPKGYNQRAAYAAGLGTPVSGKAAAGPAFARRGATQKFLSKAHKPVLLTDDERSAGSEDGYELGSFVCDDEELDFAASSQSHRA